MKSRPMRTIASTRPRGRAIRMTRGLVALTLSVGLTNPLGAAVLDDFEDGVKFATGGGGADYFTWEVSGGQLVVSHPSPVPTPLNDVGLTYDNVYWPTPRLPADAVEEGRTLELRIDLIDASADDLFLALMCGGFNAGADSAYGVMVDRNEVALLKWREGGNLALFFWDTVETPFESGNVRLALRKTPGGVDITVRIVDQDSAGTTLYQRVFTDGPGQDAPVPFPNPHMTWAWTVDEGAPYTTFTYAAVGVQQVIRTSPPPLAMRLDNLEYDVYDAPRIDSVLLSWSANLGEGQIAVSAESLAGDAVWTPCPEPIFKRFGSVCVSVPTAGACQFWKLVPGTQFIDDFSEPRQPFANRLAWEVLWNDPNDDIAVHNGVMRIRRLGPTELGLLIRPPEEVMIRDFYASMDILDFTASGDNWCAVWITANGEFGAPGSGAGALGNGAGLNFNSGARGKVIPVAWNGGPQEIVGEEFSMTEIPPPYRLELSGVGSELRFRVARLDTKTVFREQQIPRTKFFEGWIAIFVNSPDQSPTTHDLIVDNFVVTGTRPTGTAP